ncbi:hypothetical protein Syun_012561 [Stephania yunnanensis]|uniref:SNF2 N-terminal domain-containing protein n=1 Tax=Stephania yunnanensis TaxID=152371 RepID=A0AAP0JZV3_9MAGN
MAGYKTTTKNTMRVDIYCVSLSFLLHLFIVSVSIWLAEIEGLLQSSEVYHSQFSLLNEVGEFLTIVNSNKSSLLLLIRLLYRNRVLGLSQPLMFPKPNEFFWQMGLGKTLRVASLLSYLKVHELCDSDAQYSLPFDVLLTTYDIVLMDRDFLSQILWTYVVIDEAQRLKNSSSDLNQISSYSAFIVSNFISNLLGAHYYTNLFLLLGFHVALVAFRVAPLVPLQKKVYLSILRRELPMLLAFSSKAPNHQSLQNISVALSVGSSIEWELVPLIPVTIPAII